MLSHSFESDFPTNEQEVRQCSQSKVCFGPMKSFLSWLQGRHQFPFPASKLRVLLAVCFFDSGNSIVSGVSLWCPHERIFLKELLREAITKMVEFRKIS